MTEGIHAFRPRDDLGDSNNEVYTSLYFEYNRKEYCITLGEGRCAQDNYFNQNQAYYYYR